MQGQAAGLVLKLQWLSLLFACRVLFQLRSFGAQKHICLQTDTCGWSSQAGSIENGPPSMQCCCMLPPRWYSDNNVAKLEPTITDTASAVALNSYHSPGVCLQL
jgi:hypothetical protein